MGVYVNTMPSQEWMRQQMVTPCKKPKSNTSDSRGFLSFGYTRPQWSLAQEGETDVKWLNVCCDSFPFLCGSIKSTPRATPQSLLQGESSRLCESCQSAPSQQAFLSLTIYIFFKSPIFSSHFVIFKNIWVFGWVVDNTFLWCDKHISFCFTLTVKEYSLCGLPRLPPVYPM